MRQNDFKPSYKGFWASLVAQGGIPLQETWVRSLVGKIHWRRTQHPLQCSCLGNPMDRGAWRATVHEVTKEMYTTKRINKSPHHFQDRPIKTSFLLPAAQFPEQLCQFHCENGRASSSWAPGCCEESAPSCPHLRRTRASFTRARNKPLSWGLGVTAQAHPN